LRRSIVSAGRRSGIEIIAEILEEAKQGVTKTRLVYRINLNFLVIRKHLDLLLEKNLLQITDGPTKLYVTTQKGAEFLNEFRKMKEMLEPTEIANCQIASCM